MHVHLISFDVPHPPNYGGVIDVYYRVRALALAGAKVHLHIFMNDREPAMILNKICEEVHYYPRKKPSASLPIRKPHIVASRKSKRLLERLQRDSHPIIFEGLHTCLYLDAIELEFRHKLVRLHNIEWEYYYQLAQNEPNWPKSQYFLRESQMLQKFEKILLHAQHLLTISPNDTQYYQEGHPAVHYIPAFHPFDKVLSKTGIGKYCLYHGKLSVPENHAAAMFLIKHVFANSSVPLIIAGMDAPPELITEINLHPHIQLRPNPDEIEMHTLMQNAHIHVLPTSQNTGIKLKLLHALFTGRFVLVNGAMVENTGLEEYCIVSENNNEIQSMVERLMGHEFPQSEIERRQDIISRTFNNELNAKRILELLVE